MEKYLYGLVQDLFPSTEYMEWEVKDLTQPPELNVTLKKVCHYEIWNCVINHLNPKKGKIHAFSLEALSFARQVAIVLMKINGVVT